MLRFCLAFCAVLALAAGDADDVDREQLDAARAAVSTSNNALAIDLYQALRGTPGNLVLSPLSVGVVLAEAYLGAAGDTAQQIQSAVHLPEDTQQLEDGYRTLIDSLHSSQNIAAKFANKMFAQQGLNISESFKEVIVKNFASSIEEINFGDAEAARLAINAWAERATAGKIRNLFKEGSLDSQAVLVLVNAIYFKGSWLKMFDESDTQIETFYTSSSSSANVSMMHRTARFGYAKWAELNCSALELPYANSSIKMLILLPDTVDGLSNLEANLGSINWTQSVNDLERWRQVEVSLPKFQIKTSLTLKETLEELGIVDLFSNRANLTGISDGPLQVSKVIQKTFIEVNEKGTEAAVATGFEVIARSGRVRPRFIADHSFLFFILDDNQTIIFMGRYTGPSD